MGDRLTELRSMLRGKEKTISESTEIEMKCILKLFSFCYGCANKVPQMQWLKTIAIHFVQIWMPKCGTSLGVQWLRPGTSIAGGMDLIPGQRTKEQRPYRSHGEAKKKKKCRHKFQNQVQTILPPEALRKSYLFSFCGLLPFLGLWLHHCNLHLSISSSMCMLSLLVSLLIRIPVMTFMAH